MDLTLEQLGLIISGTINIVGVVARAIKTKDKTEAMGLFQNIIHKLFLSNNTGK